MLKMIRPCSCLEFLSQAFSSWRVKHLQQLYQELRKLEHRSNAGNMIRKLIFPKLCRKATAPTSAFYVLPDVAELPSFAVRMSAHLKCLQIQLNHRA